MVNTVTQYAGWENNLPLTTGIESVFDTSKLLSEAIDPTEWRREARSRSREISPPNLKDLSIRLLKQIPYNEIHNAIEHAGQSVPGALFRARMGRKLIMIARDSIIMSTSNSPSISYDTLRFACQAIGNVADTNAEELSVIMQAIHAVDGLSENRFDDFAQSTNSEELAIKMKTYIGTSELKKYTGNKPVSHDVYHKWRKNFRRIVNMYGLIAASEPDDDDLRAFAAKGVILNTTHGNTNDTLDR